jgi:hypothetical protein
MGRLVPSWLADYRRDWLGQDVIAGLIIWSVVGRIVIKVVFDVADDAYVEVERELAAVMARD